MGEREATANGEQKAVYDFGRTTDGPPSELAGLIAALFQHGERFVIVRRGPLCVMRYDATEWVAHKRPEKPRIVHDAADDHACLARVGFGFTRRAALRAMRRCPDEFFRQDRWLSTISTSP